MKKILIAFAACAVSAVAMSQPMDQRDGREMDRHFGDRRSMEQREMEHREMMQRAMEQRDRGGSGMDRRAMEHRDMHERRRARTWVPAHRDNDGHRMRGHYE